MATEIIQKTNKAAPKYLNKKSAMVIIGGKGVKGAFQRTPAADRERLKAKFTEYYALRALGRIMERQGTTIRRKFRNRAAVLRAAHKLMQDKPRAAGYTRGPGWQKALMALREAGVVSVRGFNITEDFKTSLAGRFGSGRKATEGNLVTKFVNAAPAADKIGRQALQDAINDVARDMAEYGAKDLLEKTFKEHSAA